ncbi:hypothetical protein AAZX31_01G123300 [Glycine max]|uniref:Uncharacterized protein n=2 Tax=Glycine subgen. Soja TaxID=1462606 RepID=K7K3N6_SOYBN|nr:hypothetical protein JHK86_001666 [Glycine max]KAH1162949.1 hypothetical protein GYH30_001464 [Glycine max]KRH76150.1 hypothetical protein GLYMA_01G134700v4 [Glycine max]RZC29824.1 hypothetical protein D0Y65_001431 [Glycine soja]RZC29825.1 hypothetical protein D0Y65_001431 [Glycine soja]
MDSGIAISSPKPYSVITTGSNASKASQHKRKTQMKYKVTKVQQPSLNHLTNALKEGLHIKNATYNML